MPTSVTIPAANVLGFPGSLGADGWARLHQAQQEVNYKHGVVEGLDVAPAAGTRQVSVSAGVAVLPGLRVAVPALTLDAEANSGAARTDRVVLEADWFTSTVRAMLLKGSPSLPSVVQDAGTLWQMSLGKVPVGTSATSIAAGSVLQDKPLPRLTRVLQATAFTAQSVANGGTAKIIAQVNVPDPGWPYRLHVVAQTRFNASNSSAAGILLVHVDNVELGRTTSPQLATAGDAHMARTVAGLRTGPAVVQSLIGEVGGAAIANYVGTPLHSVLEVHQIPA